MGPLKPEGMVRNIGVQRLMSSNCVALLKTRMSGLGVHTHVDAHRQLDPFLTVCSTLSKALPRHQALFTLLLFFLVAPINN